MTPSAFHLVWLVPALPLAGAAVNLFAGKKLGKLAGWLASALLAAALAISVAILSGMLGLAAGDRLFVQHLFDWISAGSFQVGADLRIDPLSVTMILVVTGVGTLIHVYAIGYMEHDPRFGRFFAYLNLFAFFMLMLVLAQNYLLLYLGWEGVGLCSYLLIGFWFERKSAADAAKKAFITTRIGDTAMMVGLALIVVKFGTLDFSRVLVSRGGSPGYYPQIGPVVSHGAVTAIALLLFAGAVGKSAQVPLHVWLPDAMEGPTPVSALIHAATMVTAGVYLVVRSHVLFEASGTALTVVLVIGLITAIYAATAALAQDDIKRVLAYSTTSQLGYMFVAAGMRAYAAAMFMLVAHAFYKALLFLSAGSVIHGAHEEQDMKQMGGLRSPMPLTATVMTIGAVSLAGIFPLAGFFAKDTILEIASTSGRTSVYLLGTFGALLSAVYIGRLVFLTFFGEARSEKAERANESPAVMTAPLVVLAIGAVAGGVLATGIEGRLPGFLEPVVGVFREGGAGLAKGALIAIALGVSVLGLAVTWFLYGSGKVDWLALRVRLSPLHRFLERAWYVDDAYGAWLGTPGKAAAAFAAYVLDARVIDGFVNGVGIATNALAAAGRRIQTGFVRNYALAFLVGAVGILLYVGLKI
ncbi:MAG: NADH-quinone oxidoreductase subunit L [Actinobacteria bacterium]|nr:NADH-quinone oxidoreductase subunit L [Actinomycetota bacterium]